MKLIMLKNSQVYMAKDRVIVGKIKEHKIFDMVYTISLGYLAIHKDFDQKAEYIETTETASIQIRPRVIYKNQVGYYRKNEGKIVYFSEKETDLIDKTINKFRKYLKTKYQNNYLEENVNG